VKSGVFVVICVALFAMTCLAYGKEVFLGELTPVSSLVHGGLKVNKDYYNETIKMDGEEYEKGIVMHVESPQGYSEVIYDVEGYRTFRADIGLSHRDAPPAGSVIFFVYIDDGKGDWIEKYKSEEIIRHETPTIQLEIDISGASQLRLYCTDAGNGINSDHATFADARLDTASLSGIAVKPLKRLATTWADVKKQI
jgi:hypothetical protein